MKKNLLWIILFVITACSTQNFIKINDTTVYKNMDAFSEKASAELVQNYQGKMIKVVLFPFLNHKKIFCELGYLLSSQMKTFLFQSGKFEILERLQLDAVLNELKMTSSDLFSQESISKIGKFIGADAVLIGDISAFNNYFIVSMRLVNIEEAKVVSLSQVNLLSEGLQEKYETRYQFQEKQKVLSGDYQVTVMQGDVKEDFDIFSDPDTFVCISQNNIQSCTLAVEDNFHPKWNQEIEMEINPEKPIIITVWDKDTSADDLISRFVLSENYSSDHLDENGKLYLSDEKIALSLRFKQK